MEKLIIIFILATAIEGIVEFFGQFIAQSYFSPNDPARERKHKTDTYTRWSMVISTLLGIVICFWGQLGILEILNVAHKFPWGVDYTLCGIIIGRGSKSVHDFIRKLDSLKERGKNPPPNEGAGSSWLNR